MKKTMFRLWMKYSKVYGRRLTRDRLKDGNTLSHHLFLTLSNSVSIFQKSFCLLFERFSGKGKIKNGKAISGSAVFFIIHLNSANLLV